MAIERRDSAYSGAQAKGIGNGPYLAKVVGHLDPSFMGGLEVTLLRDSGNTIGSAEQTYTVKCATPFYGNTSFDFMGDNPTDFNDTQKSYGMWFVPPDVGVTVLVVFIDGNPAHGYWIGCIPGRFMNHMIPAIAGSTNVELTPEDKKKYGNTKQPLPVGEINRRINTLEQGVKIDSLKKPVHPIAERFLEQGTLEDDVRGTSTSTARRQVPNMVFGISTPGPLDRRPGAKRAVIGKNQTKTSRPVPVSRLGGTQMVFDDGDDQYQRKTPASEGGVDYTDVLDSKDLKPGQVDIPYNEHFRIRTRTGHQILLHNSEDLIYIGNARGTTWIELTSNGKIDVFAQDSVSIHTGNDLNIRADRDINLEAGRNINMRAESGRMHVEVFTDLMIYANDEAKLTVGANMEILVGGNSKISTVSDFHLNSGGNNNLTANTNTNISSGVNHVETAAGRITMNGPAATPAETAEAVKPLPLHENIATTPAAGWDKRYQNGTLPSIMRRIPMHEPWALHENNAPQQLTPDNTDREGT